jgi:restriction system protein
VSDYRRRDEQAKQDYANRLCQYHEAERQHKMQRSAFLERIATHNAEIDHERSAYERGDQLGVARAMTRVLMNSELPAEFPDVVDVEYDQGNRVLHVVRVLPALDEMPSVKGYRVIKKDRELKEQPLTDAATKRLYDTVVYQLALRTIHELFKGDVARHVRSIDLKCVIDGFDPATGHPGQLVLARLRVEREHLDDIKLENVDPEACFKNLGGKTSSRPSNLRPIEVLPDLKC